MNTFTTWSEAVRMSFTNLWFHFVDVIPNIIGAIVFLIIGLVLANALAALARRLIKLTGLDQALERTRLTERARAAGVTLTVSGFFAWLVKWFIILVTLSTIADILHWTQVTDFLRRMVVYLPN